jgi:hypothetical protein
MHHGVCHIELEALRPHDALFERTLCAREIHDQRPGPDASTMKSELRSTAQPQGRGVGSSTKTKTSGKEERPNRSWKKD